MATVNKICADHNIDLDDESDAPASQTSRSDPFFEEDEIDLQDVIGIGISEFYFCTALVLVFYLT